MGLSTVAETVTVSGAAPVVDVTATSGASLFTKEVLDLTPTTRNGAMSLLTMAPGVRSFIDIGGSQTEENAGAKAFGQAGQVYYTLEGVMGNNWTAAGGSGTVLGFSNHRQGARPEHGDRPGIPHARRADQCHRESGR